MNSYMEFVDTKTIKFTDSSVIFVDIFKEGPYFYIFNSIDGEQFEITIDGETFGHQLDIDQYIEFCAFTIVELEPLEYMNKDDENDDIDLCWN